MSLDDSVLSSGHSCRGLGGLVLARISTHQLRNSVEIAALIPSWVRREDPPHSGGQSSASSMKQGFDGPAADTGLASVFPVFTRRIPTLQRAVYLVDFISRAWGHRMVHGDSGKPKRWAEIKETPEGQAGPSCITGSLWGDCFKAWTLVYSCQHRRHQLTPSASPCYSDHNSSCTSGQYWQIDLQQKCVAFHLSLL